MGGRLGEDGFIQSPRRIAMDLGLSAAAVYGALWYFSRFSDHVCKAAVETIANFACVSIRTTETCLKLLVENRYITDLDPGLKNRVHRYVVGDIKAMQDVSDATDVAETLLSERNGYTKEGEIYSANFAEQGKKQSANIAEQNIKQSAILAEQIENGLQNMSDCSAKNVSSHSGENTKFADDIDNLKELNLSTEFKPTSEFPFLSEIQKPEISENLSPIEQAQKYYAFAKSKMSKFGVTKADLITWFDSLSVEQFDKENKHLVFGIANSYAREKVEKSFLSYLLIVLRYVWIEDITAEVVVVHKDYLAGGLLKQ